MNMPLAPCGLDCSQCDCYIATINNDLALKTKLADQAREHQGMDIKPEDLNCVGCIMEGAHISYVDDCKIRACVLSRKLANCAYCVDYPCPEVTAFHKMAPKAKVNIENTREEL